MKDKSIQEEIREYMARFLAGCLSEDEWAELPNSWHPDKDYKDKYYDDVDEILKYLDSKGAMVEIPQDFIQDDGSYITYERLVEE